MLQVHALRNVVSFVTDTVPHTDFDPNRHSPAHAHALNARLPADIRVTACFRPPMGFSPRAAPFGRWGTRDGA